MSSIFKQVPAVQNDSGSEMVLTKNDTLPQNAKHGTNKDTLKSEQAFNASNAIDAKHFQTRSLGSERQRFRNVVTINDAIVQREQTYMDK